MTKAILAGILQSRPVNLQIDNVELQKLQTITWMDEQMKAAQAREAKAANKGRMYCGKSILS